ncbi:hypothetical protein Tco_0010043 [Tanacetum coccineum]
MRVSLTSLAVTCAKLLPLRIVVSLIRREGRIINENGGFCFSSGFGNGFDEIMNDAIPLVNGAAAKEDGNPTIGNTPLGGNGIDVVVPVESICAISDRFANTTYGFFLGRRVAYPVVANYVRNTWSSYARVMIELRADVELKDNIVVAMPRIKGEDHLHHNSDAGEKKTMKKPSQTSRGVLVGPKIGFKPQKEYRPVPKSLMLLYNDGNPLVPMGIVESDSEVEVGFDENSNLRILTSDKDESDKDYGTNSLLE